MKTSTKILSVLLALVMVLSCMPFAFAQEGEPGQAEAKELKAEVVFDKEQYGLFDTVTATIKLTNVSDKVIQIKRLYVISQDCRPQGHIQPQNLEFLYSGATDSFDCTFNLSSRASGLNFFAKILLFFRELFGGGLVLSTNQETSHSESFSVIQEEYYANFGKYGKHAVTLLVGYDVFECSEEQIEEAIELYNNAAQAGTDKTGKITMSLVDGSLKLGSLNQYLSVLEPAVKDAPKKSEYELTEIPGHPPITADDVVGVSVKKENGKTTVVIILEDQTDGYNADAENGGAVSRGIGTMGSVSDALGEMGAEIKSGEETISLKYTNALIGVEIDDSTGKIISGSWSYRVFITVGEAEFGDSSMSVNIKGLEAAVDYNIIFNEPQYTVDDTYFDDIMDHYNI